MLSAMAARAEPLSVESPFACSAPSMFSDRLRSGGSSRRAATTGLVPAISYTIAIHSTSVGARGGPDSPCTGTPSAGTSPLAGYSRMPAGTHADPAQRDHESMARRQSASWCSKNARLSGALAPSAANAATSKTSADMCAPRKFTFSTTE